MRPYPKVLPLSQSLAIQTQSNNDSPAGLYLPDITLRVFTGKENLDRFIEQLTSSSGVSPIFWVTYFKQQTQKDARASSYVLIEAEKQQKHLLGARPDNTSPAEFGEYFNTCVETFIRSKAINPTRDQKICDLLHQYYKTRQGHKE